MILPILIQAGMFGGGADPEPGEGSRLILDDGGYLLLDDGGRVLLDGPAAPAVRYNLAPYAAVIYAGAGRSTLAPHAAVVVPPRSA